MGSQFKQLKDRANRLLKNLDSNKNGNFNELIDVMRQLNLELEDLHATEDQYSIDASHNKYAILYDLAPISYFIINANGLITDVNSTGAELLGIKTDFLINRSFTRYVSLESQDIFADYLQRAFIESHVETCELKLLTRKGPVFTAKLEGRMIREEAPLENKLLLMITDISAYKQQTDKLPSQTNNQSSDNHSISISEFNMVRSHELNQPLGVISNYIHGCIRRLESGSYDIDQILLALKQSAQQLNRASDIILRINNFNYKKNSERQAVCIDSMIKEAIELAQLEINDFPVTITYHKNKHISDIILDKLLIQQVILHLTRNAIEAMRDAGVEDPKLSIEVNQSKIDAIEICVMDNGPGFVPEHTHKLFEPHFTTKPYGVGLGLVVSRTIVESHGGRLFADLNLTYGACFKFTLPTQPA